MSFLIIAWASSYIFLTNFLIVVLLVLLTLAMLVIKYKNSRNTFVFQIKTTILKLQKIRVKRLLALSKKNFQGILLLLILLIITFPYLTRASVAVISWGEDQIMDYKYWYALDKREKLLNKYGITTIGYNTYAVYTDYGVFMYLNTYKELKGLWKDFDCSKKLPVPTPNPKSKSVFRSEFANGFYSLLDKYEQRLRPTRPVQQQVEYDKEVISKCNELKANEDIFNQFNEDIPNIKQLISENYSSSDNAIKDSVEQLKEELENYNKAKIEAGYLSPSNQTNEILKLKEAKSPDLNPEDRERYYRIYKNPFVLHLRKALNAYLANDKELAWALDKFDRGYYRSKFIVLSLDQSVMGGVMIDILFQNKPDKIFSAWVYKLSDDKYELRGFNRKEHFDEKAAIKEMIDYYKPYLFDKEHAL